MNRLALLVLTMALASCEHKEDGFVARVFYTHSGQTMPYRLFIPPKYEKSNEYPLIIWLHGVGGAGTDNLRQIQGDQIPGTHLWTTATNQARHPAFVVVPQTVGVWDSSGSTVRGMSEGAEARQITSQLVQVLGILDELTMEFHIDSRRLYVAGQSAGGFGTWNLITKKPGVFAAAIVLCGGGNTDLAGNVKDMPIWSFQGDADFPGFLNSNRNMIAAVKTAGGNPRYTEYPGVGHEIWDRVFKEPGLVEWLFAQHK
jgi:predicted peptidase